jgi:N-methylhydantoinase A
MCSPATAARYPARVLESGPAAGILSAAHTAVQAGATQALAFDMGGTTAKACLVTDGEPALTEELDVARLERTTPGSGLPMRVPSVDLVEIGAGGGSIAWIDGLGILQVGPESSGSDPGPACYARGGERPTVTDADVVLGYLLPEFFAGGAMSLDVDRARTAIAAHVLEVTGASDGTAAAWGIHDIVNENMARVGRLHCLDHGVDPGDVTIVATGGAGPVHACGVMAKVGARRLICPPSAGVASAFGLLLAPRTVDRAVTDVVRFDTLTDSSLQERLAAMATELATDREPGGTMTAWLSLRLMGQGYEVRVRMPEAPTLDEVRSEFEREYAVRFGRKPFAGQIEIVEWMVRLAWPRDVLDDLITESASDGTASGRTQAYFGPLHGWLETQVTNRRALRAAGSAAGPLLLPEDGTTVVVGPGYEASVDDFGNVVIELSSAPRVGEASTIVNAEVA